MQDKKIACECREKRLGKKNAHGCAIYGSILCPYLLFYSFIVCLLFYVLCSISFHVQHFVPAMACFINKVELI